MRQPIFVWWIPLLLVSILAYVLQTHLYLHKDVALITHTAARMLAHETYTKNIFEPNPPLIFYLSMPAILLAKWLSISVLSTIRLYLITLIFISSSCSYFIIKKLFKDNIFLIYLLAYVMVYVLLFLPAHQFAQREHFLLILVLPYLFLTALRLSNKNINILFAVVIGCMAGIGFALKPHFFPALLLIEIYFIYQARRWVRTEIICMLSIFVIYGLSVFLFYPDYIYQVLPLWMPYYTAIAHPFLEIMLHPALLYCLAVMLFYLITRHLNHYKTICDLFMVALIGFICSYIIPQVPWYYHIYPALGIACLLAAIIIASLFRQLIQTSRLKSILLFIAMMSIVYLTPLTLSIQYFFTSIRYFNSDNSFARLIGFFKQQKMDTTFYLLAMTHDTTVLEFYTSTHYVGCFPFLMWEYTQILPENRLWQKAYIAMPLINKISNELNEKKPDFVIVDIPSSQDYLGIKINYIEKYSHYKNFKIAWQNYRYLQKIGPYEIYIRKK